MEKLTLFLFSRNPKTKRKEDETMFNVLYKDDNGRQWVQECLTASSFEYFTAALKASNIDFDIKEVDDKKFQLCECAFTHDDVELIEKGKKDPYTFADPNNIAKPGDIVLVQLKDGKQKNVYVMNVRNASISEIRAFCAKIGYKKLGKVLKLIFRPRK